MSTEIQSRPGEEIPPPPGARKVIQVAVQGDHLVVLCDDATVWIATVYPRKASTEPNWFQVGTP
jgi:hypothetical protein